MLSKDEKKLLQVSTSAAYVLGRDRASLPCNYKVGTCRCPKVGDIVLINRGATHSSNAGRMRASDKAYNYIGEVIKVYPALIQIKNNLKKDLRTGEPISLTNSMMMESRTDISSGFTRYICLSNLSELELDSLHQEQLEIEKFKELFTSCCSNLGKYIRQATEGK